MAIYCPYAPQSEVLRWKEHGNKVITYPAPGKVTADVGDVAIYKPPPGEFSTMLATIANWDKPYVLVADKTTECCIAQVATHQTAKENGKNCTHNSIIPVNSMLNARSTRNPEPPSA